MLDRYPKRLVTALVAGLLALIASIPMAQASPITIYVTGDIQQYATLHFEFATGITTFLGQGSSGTLSGTFTWDPALMGTDLSAPPSLSHHLDAGGYYPWLTSSLTAVTPDYTRVYAPSPSATLFLSYQVLDGQLQVGSTSLQASANYFNPATGSYAYNFLNFVDYSSPLALTLGSSSGQFVPLLVDFTLAGPNTGSLYAATFIRQYPSLGPPMLVR